ncbi:50S ribosomal protein l4 [Heliomicrobium modesticaldum Ice1]|uniref:Large ribosomal subunit protein uL4 n=1 Tax=Heliobacterium modesticaldum (strain ATCC 51547 / Ice1) TaxID=498761 RepID=RL4_HELMI|nr:50S ribosomal protein L4 [Heliomicrobium modesticaldum]B0TC57.1 RecName: Full=Large ribosomal subunit protein uL4; AltName: Full=50S ribosomal protein L4 [Heliomicrobium modesticaldum Ice1]ABZ83956.1 50S ribosomal protein l4 [Heliomicrobium modesticaldum Ice1]
MPKVALYNTEGAQVGEIELNDAIFGIEPNEAVMHQAVVTQLAAWRRGTHKVKSRGEVSGGGKKPWRQKGTGRARAGTSRSPLWRGGAIIFGPQPRSYKIAMPKKVRRLALKSALSDKVRSGNLIVVDALEMDAPKTKVIAGILNKLKVERKALLVTADIDETVFKSARNIPGVSPVEAVGINVYDILNHDKLVITKNAVAKVEEVFA